MIMLLDQMQFYGLAATEELSDDSCIIFGFQWQIRRFYIQAVQHFYRLFAWTPKDTAISYQLCVDWILLLD